MVLMAAGIILISSLSAAFYYQMDSMEEDEIENRKIAKTVSQLDESDGQKIRQRLTFDDESEGIYISPKIRGSSYTIEITTGYVEVKKDGETSWKKLHADVHLWNPEDLNETGRLGEDEENWRDSRAEPVKIESGETDLKLVMLNLENDQISENHVFIQEVDVS